MRRLLAILAVLLGLAPASAQQQVNLSNFPASSVVGRLGSSVNGPAQAISFATLLAQLNSVSTVIAAPSSAVVVGDLATWANTAGTLLQDAGSGTVTGAYTWSGNQTWRGTGSFSSTTSFTGTMTGPDSATWSSSGVSGTKLNNSSVGATTASTGTFTTLTVDGQLIPAYGTPTIASAACGALTNGTLASGSTNQSGEVEIASATTTSCTISFSATLSAAPLACVIFPANSTAAATGTTVAYVSAITTAHWVITGSALASADYYYHCF